MGKFTPAERAKKFGQDLKEKKHTAGKRAGQELTAGERAWRAGYLAARQDAAEYYKDKKNGKENKNES